MKLDVPDLRRLLVGLGSAVHERAPDVITPHDVKRIREANNVLLVLARVLAGMAQKTVLTPDEVREIAEQARYVPDSGDIFDARPSDDGVVTGRMTTWDVLSAVDSMLHVPESRARVPDWFVTQFWPGVLRRVASGGQMTDREREVAMYVASAASGER